METRRNPVYVVNRKGKPLDPTFRYGHVRKLMKEGKAVPISNEPFTIRLKYDTPDIVMGLYGGLDTGRENLGLAASKDDGECVYLSDVRTERDSEGVVAGMTVRANSARRNMMVRKFRMAMMTRYGQNTPARPEKFLILEQIIP